MMEQVYKRPFMKISELAKQLNINPTELRHRISDFGIDIGKKARTVKDKTAEEIIKKIEAEKKILEINQEKEESEKKEPKETEEKVKPIKIGESITVKDFSAAINQPVTEVIKRLMMNGVMATINESIDFETAAIIAEEFDVKVREEKEKEEETKDEGPKELKDRPPVITVMGHVDHGKTSLLDKIRETNVVAGESGGITQHIGAYRVSVKTKEGSSRPGEAGAGKKRVITFLDTPGHEAFTAMRAHGAKITDIAVLVVAADDGVKPQTKEAIDHAKSAGVPIIIAINKIDKPAADPQRVKKELADYGLSTEDWGGSTPFALVSAKEGKGIDELMELILLVADLQELKANYAGHAQGVVIESQKDPQIGPRATILVQKGILQTGAPVIIGKVYGKIRRMKDDLGKIITSAQPSDPVTIIGLSDVPGFGETLIEVESEKEAKKLVEETGTNEAKKVLGISEVAQNVREGKLKELNIILKCDVDGSISAIRDSLAAISSEDVKVKIIRAAVGDITETDIMMAQASNALVIGFRVATSPAAKKIASQNKIKISNYDVIYQLIDDVYAAASGLLEPEIVETEVGKLKVLATFAKTKTKQVIGGKVTEGVIEKDLDVDIYRESEKIGHGKLANLQQNKKNVSSVEEGFECGLEIETSADIQEDDKIMAIRKEEILKKLSK